MTRPATPFFILALFSSAMLLPSLAQAAPPIAGEVEVNSSLGQYLALKMTIDDTKTTFELTGPDYSWFAFGFDTTVMQGYTLIIEGLDDTRTAVEQNLVGTGNPGVPQLTQNISILSTTHDTANDLTTIVIERLSHTGDTEDPDFLTSMSALDVTWAYHGAASPENPSPTLGNHGGEGRGVTFIAFSPVPEPGSASLVAMAGALLLYRRRLRLR